MWWNNLTKKNIKKVYQQSHDFYFMVHIISNLFKNFSKDQNLTWSLTQRFFDPKWATKIHIVIFYLENLEFEKDLFEKLP